MNYKISVEETGEVERSIQIEIPRDVYDGRYKDLLRKTASRVQLKGFRPGKAPHSFVEKMYRSRLENDVIGELVDTAFRDAVTEHSLQVVGNPRINVEPIEAEKDVLVRAEVSIFPEPKIKDYKGISFSAELEEFNSDRVEHDLEHLVEHFATREPITNRDVAKEKDVVRIDFKGTIDGEPFEGSQGKERSVELGKSSFPEEFENGIIGMTCGETKTIEVQLPEGLVNEKFAGKTAVYEVTLKGLEKKILPDLTDEFVKEKGISESVAVLREQVEKRLKKNVERTNKERRELALFDAISAKNPFKIPQAMVDEEIRTMLIDAGFLNAEDKASYKIDMTPFRERLSDEADKRVRRAIILGQIVDQEKVEVTDDDINSWLDTEAVEASCGREEIDKIYGFPKNKERLRIMLARKSMVERLLEEAEIEVTSPGVGKAKSVQKAEKKPRKTKKKSE